MSLYVNKKNLKKIILGIDNVKKTCYHLAIVKNNTRQKKETVKMKEYNVECAEITAAMIAGREPWNCIKMNISGDLTMAANSDAAIDLVLDWIVDNNPMATIEKSPVRGDYKYRVICRDNDNNITGGFAFFTATEIDE